MLSIVSLDIYWSSYDYDSDYTYIQYIYIWSLIDGWLVGISGSISSSGHLLRSRHLLALFLFIWMKGSEKEFELIVGHFIYRFGKREIWFDHLPDRARLWIQHSLGSGSDLNAILAQDLTHLDRSFLLVPSLSHPLLDQGNFSDSLWRGLSVDFAWGCSFYLWSWFISVIHLFWSSSVIDASRSRSELDLQSIWFHLFDQISRQNSLQHFSIDQISRQKGLLIHPHYPRLRGWKTCVRC